MYACVYVPDFAVQAAARLHPELKGRAVAVLDGEPPLEKVFAVNQKARAMGLSEGMGRLQIESFAGVEVISRSKGHEEEHSAQAALCECASEFSPRIESMDANGTVVLDISGTERLFGSARELAARLRNKIAEAGLVAQIAVAQNFHASICAARGSNGTTIVPAGKEHEALAPMPLEVLQLPEALSATFEMWGIRDCGALAALPEGDLIARMGQEGKRSRALARGEWPHLLVPDEAEFDAKLNAHLELEHPVELLEPLLFILARLLEELMRRSRESAMAIASVRTQLTLENGTHERTIRPALPTQDARTLLKLLRLDLEMNPPAGAIHGARMQAISAKPHRAQHGLFLPQAPEPGRLEVLLARLRKLLGADRLGAVELLDTHRADGFRMTPFTAEGGKEQAGKGLGAEKVTALRVCRPPVAIRVALSIAEKKPACVWMERDRLAVIACSGPWRKDGEWWSHTNWCREEWDVVLSDENICRIAHDPASGCWYLQGTYD